MKIEEAKIGQQVLVDMKSVMPASTLDEDGRFLVEGVIVGLTKKRIKVDNLARGIGVYKPENIYVK